MQVVQVADLDHDLPGRIGPGRAVSRHCRSAGQEWSHDRSRVGFKLTRAALGDHRAAAGSCAGAEFDHPVRRVDELPLVLDHQDRVPIARQRANRLAQSLDVAGVQPDRRLIQHVEHPGGAGAHRRGQFDPLALAGRQRRASPVQGQVTETDVEQRREPGVEFGEQSGRHPADLGRQPGGQAGREAAQLSQAQRTDLGQVAAT